MNGTIGFGRHPSDELQKLYETNPFQIQEPEKAKIIFLSRDANWDYNIDQNDCFFNDVIKYLEDGVKYWKKNNIHTPLLKPCYKGEGKAYHRNFHKLGFTSDNAEDICLFELLNYCTFGRSSKNDTLFFKEVSKAENKKHRDRIKDFAKMGKIICIPDSKDFKKIIDKLELFDTDGENIIKHASFSTAISNKKLEELKETLHKFLKGK